MAGEETPGVGGRVCFIHSPSLLQAASRNHRYTGRVGTGGSRDTQNDNLYVVGRDGVLADRGVWSAGSREV